MIFLAARYAEDDLVRGLGSGGDDDVVKPPKQRELVARVNAALRRHAGESESDETIELAPYSVDPKHRRVSIGGRDVELTQREYDLACFLLRRHGRISVATRRWKMYGISARRCPRARSICMSAGCARNSI